MNYLYNLNTRTFRLGNERARLGKPQRITPVSSVREAGTARSGKGEAAAARRADNSTSNAFGRNHHLTPLQNTARLAYLRTVEGSERAVIERHEHRELYSVAERFFADAPPDQEMRRQHARLAQAMLAERLAVAVPQERDHRRSIDPRELEGRQRLVADAAASQAAEFSIALARQTAARDIVTEAIADATNAHRC